MGSRFENRSTKKQAPSIDSGSTATEILLRELNRKHDFVLVED